MSLTKTHPHLDHGRDMISGRYRSEKLCSNWSFKNQEGFCLLSPDCSSLVEDIPHILSSCSSLQPTRDKLIKFTEEYCKSAPSIIQTLVSSLCKQSSPLFCQFLLDSSILPEVIAAVQTEGEDVLSHLFHIGRTWIYTLHKTRMKLLGRWNYI